MRVVWPSEAVVDRLAFWELLENRNPQADVRMSGSVQLTLAWRIFRSRTDLALSLAPEW